MPKPKGPQDSQVAVFIFKDDEKNQLAWEDAGEIPHSRIELHTNKASFLPALAAWQAAVREPDNAHLLIYAHGHSRGLAARTERGAQVVSWGELGSALDRTVAVLWVVGCQTKHALAAWPTPTVGPARSSLLVTTATLDWRPLIEHFQKEVDISDFVYFDMMKSYLKMKAKDLGYALDYLDAAGKTWAAFDEKEYVDYGKSSPATAKELEALWGPPFAEDDDDTDDLERRLAEHQRKIDGLMEGANELRDLLKQKREEASGKLDPKTGADVKAAIRSNERLIRELAEDSLGHRERCAFVASGREGTCSCGYKL